jgi:hypothetical protein
VKEFPPIEAPIPAGTPISTDGSFWMIAERENLVQELDNLVLEDLVAPDSKMERLNELLKIG